MRAEDGAPSKFHRSITLQAEQKIKIQILSSLGTDQVFRLLSDHEVGVVMKTLGLLRNLLSTKPHIDLIMAQHGRQIMQAVILILEGEHSPDVKEQALCGSDYRFFWAVLPPPVSVF